MKLQRRNRGITMLELILSLALTAVLLAALEFAFASAIRSETIIQAKRINFESQYQIQDRITKLLQHAWINTLPAPPTTPAPGGTAGGAGTAGGGAGTTQPAGGLTQNLTGGQASYFTSNPVAPTGGLTAQNSTSMSSGNGQGSVAGGGAQQLVFTALGLPIQAYALYSQDDFPTANQDFGPQGGVEEISFSMTPAGDAGNSQGLFIRIQRPGDDDPTQGGTESLLIPNAQNISFEFWDGTVWQPSWDTTQQATKRLPAAVRVSYQDQAGKTYAFTVWLINSDVTPLNPVAAGAN